MCCALIIPPLAAGATLQAQAHDHILVVYL